MPDLLPDYYSILGVRNDATPLEIHEAFRHRAQECHPDLHPGDQAAAERFKAVNEAYHLLSDREERRAYDARRTQLEAGHVDVEALVVIGLREVYTGCRVRLDVPRAARCPSCEGRGCVEELGREPCPACGGSGWSPEEIYLGVRSRERCDRCRGQGRLERRSGPHPCLPCRGVGWLLVPTPTDVRLPAGLVEGELLRVPGQGQPLLNGGHGDLFVRIRVRPGPWERQGEDVVWDVGVPPRLLATGGRLPFSTPLESVWISVPKGARYGLTIQLRRMGPPSARGGPRANLWVRLVPASGGR
jgi:molecular chaperone DnaJ